jgi:hypothetical protein
MGSESARLGASFRDPSGFLFQRNQRLYRQVNRAYQADYDLLIGSGLYDELADAGLLIRHRETDAAPEDPALAYRVIEPEPVSFISYPYEWSFGQLQAAALTTLEIQKRALARGMSLKDSSAYNIQFHRGQPLLIDSLSFEAYREGEPWDAYRQFCQHFLAPLELRAHVHPALASLSRGNLDGVPLDLASALLPAKSKLRPAISTVIAASANRPRRNNSP